MQNNGQDGEIEDNQHQNQKELQEEDTPTMEIVSKRQIQATK